MIERLPLHVLDRATARRASLARLAFAAGFHAEIYASIEELLEHAPDRGIVLASDDPHAPVSELIAEMAARGSWLPVVALADGPETARVVAAIKAGALDYLPFALDEAMLHAAVARVWDAAEAWRAQHARMADARARLARLSQREREVLDRLAAGCSNKAIARQLEISPRTVEIHRMKMMGKLGARHAAEAVRLRVQAVGLDDLAA